MTIRSLIKNYSSQGRVFFENLRVPELRQLCKTHKVNLKSKRRKALLVETLEEFVTFQTVLEQRKCDYQSEERKKRANAKRRAERKAKCRAEPEAKREGHFSQFPLFEDNLGRFEISEWFYGHDKKERRERLNDMLARDDVISLIQKICRNENLSVKDVVSARMERVYVVPTVASFIYTCLDGGVAYEVNTCDAKKLRSILNKVGRRDLR